MLLAETAVLAHFDTVRIVALILHRVVIALLALRAGQRDLHANTSSSHVQDTSFFPNAGGINACQTCSLIIRYSPILVNPFF